MALIPFSLLPLVLYAVAAFIGYGDAVEVGVQTGQVAPHPYWSRALLSVTLVSGESWALSYGDGLIIIALAMLLLSILRAASPRPTSVLGNMVAVIVLCVYIVAFLTMELAATSVFFILTAIALVDTLSMVSLSMVASHSRVEAVPQD